MSARRLLRRLDTLLDTLDSDFNKCVLMPLTSDHGELDEWHAALHTARDNLPMYTTAVIAGKPWTSHQREQAQKLAVAGGTQLGQAVAFEAHSRLQHDNKRTSLTPIVDHVTSDLFLAMAIHHVIPDMVSVDNSPLLESFIREENGMEQPWGAGDLATLIKACVKLVSSDRAVLSLACWLLDQRGNVDLEPLRAQISLLKAQHTSLHATGSAAGDSPRTDESGDSVDSMNRAWAVCVARDCGSVRHDRTAKVMFRAESLCQCCSCFRCCCWRKKTKEERQLGPKSAATVEDKPSSTSVMSRESDFPIHLIF